MSDNPHFILATLYLTEKGGHFASDPSHTIKSIFYTQLYEGYFTPLINKTIAGHVHWWLYLLVTAGRPLQG